MAADVFRLLVLKKGGWYFDLDFYPLRPISEIEAEYKVDDKVFLTQQFGEQNSPRKLAKAIANGVIGIEEESPLWETIDDLVRRACNYSCPDRTVLGPQLMTSLWVNSSDSIVIGDREDFYPFSWGSEDPFTCRDKVISSRLAYKRLLGQAIMEDSLKEILKMNHIHFTIHLWAGGATNV